MKELRCEYLLVTMISSLDIKSLWCYEKRHLLINNWVEKKKASVQNGRGCSQSAIWGEEVAGFARIW